MAAAAWQLARYRLPTALEQGSCGTQRAHMPLETTGRSLNQELDPLTV